MSPFRMWQTQTQQEKVTQQDSGVILMLDLEFE